MMLWLSIVACVASLLTFFKAPDHFSWMIEIGVTEWGHWAAFFCFLLLPACNWRRRRGLWAAGFFLIALGLFLSPFAQASRISKQLPQELSSRWGNIPPRERAGAPARTVPLSFLDGLRGIYSPGVQRLSVDYTAQNGQTLHMDVYRPLDFDQPMPGVLVIHGGGWDSGDRRDLTALNRYLAARGYLVASIEYRLAPNWRFPAARDDVFSAIGHLKAHAKDLGLNPDALVLLGRSAGGQIALSTAYLGREYGIRGVIAFYSPNDLEFAYEIKTNPLILDSQKLISDYIGGPPDSHRALYHDASPINFVDAHTLPTLLIHGERDELVWVVHSQRLSEKLAEARCPYYFLSMPWATHGCDANLSGPCGQLSTYTIERFLAYTLPVANEARLATIKRSHDAKHKVA